MKNRIQAAIELIDNQDVGKDPETHARYRGMRSGLQAILDWMRMSE